MTYQRNMCVLEDAVDQGLPDGVHQAEPAAGDEDEPEHDGRGLEDVLAIRPLHTAQLLDAVTQEGEDPPALLVRAGPRLLAHGRIGAAGGDRRLLERIGRPDEVVLA